MAPQVKLQLEIDENDSDEEIKRKIMQALPEKYKDKKIIDLNGQIKQLRAKAHEVAE